MATTIIVPAEFTVAAAIQLARDNKGKLIINPDTHQALITDGVVLKGFVAVIDPTRPNQMARRVSDAYSIPD